MELWTTVTPLLFLYCFNPSGATSLITGQRVCRAGKGRPCYKLAYFSELRRRLNFVEAELACRRDGGELLSVESEAEQRLIEQLVTELRPSDGDFWIGLRRNQGDGDSSSDCSPQYYWQDGCKATYRNWHWDEPSCGYEVCVVMYHQPSAPAGQGGGLYMFQWNDDNCETKNNFICKYTSDQLSDVTPSPNATQSDVVASVLPWTPSERNSDQNTALNLVYIIIPTIPLILLFLTVMGVCCFKMFGRRRTQQKSEVCQTEPVVCPSPASGNVYNVIRAQKEDDLVSTRPHTKNTSFLGSSPDTPTGDYDNLGSGRDTESGFVTLASTESCFLNYDLNDLSLGRRSTLYDRSLGRPVKRDINLNGSSLGRTTGHRDYYDRSLGRRTTKSEHYSSGVYPDPDLYDPGLFDHKPRPPVPKADLYDPGLFDHKPRPPVPKADLYDPGLFDPKPRPPVVKADLYDPGLYDPKPRPPVVKADLYQTYVNNGKEDTFQTSLGTYGHRKSYQSNLDYRSGLVNLESGRRYLDWINRENY